MTFTSSTWQAARSVLPFLIGLIVTLTSAILAPGVGARDGLLPSVSISKLAVAAIFLIQGMQLPASEVRRGLGSWRIHFFVQAWMFLVCPLLAGLIILLYGTWLEPVFQSGLLFLAFLATTIAMNAAFSAKAGGNGAVSLFNIVIGNMLGVFVTPAVLLYLLASQSEVAMNYRPLLVSITLQLIVPFAIGQLLRIWLTDWIQRWKPQLRETTSVFIFTILYFSFCNMLSGDGGELGGATLPIVLSASLLLLLLNKATCYLALRAMPMDQPMRTAAFYAATQKTLAAGLPLAGAVYATADTAAFPPMALLCLPLIMYHMGQLILGALLIPFFASSQSKTG